MMKFKSFIVLAVVFLCTCPVSASYIGIWTPPDKIEFNDGLTHDIDNPSFLDVYVDYQTSDMYTTVNLIDFAIISSIYGYEDSTINIYGGYIQNDLHLQDQSLIKIFGYDFAVDGQAVGYGEFSSIFGGLYSDEPSRHLTGTLLNGTFINGGAIDCDFYIGHDAKIILIPEPATVLLLGLGGLILKRRKL